MGLFIALIVASFKRVGLILRSLRDPRGPAAFLTWALGVSLFGHCLSFISITYFDQLIIIWFWLLAVISSIPITSRQQSPRKIQPHEINENPRRTILSPQRT
jgi:hypothetical protein